MIDALLDPVVMSHVEAFEVHNYNLLVAADLGQVTPMKPVKCCMLLVQIPLGQAELMARCRRIAWSLSILFASSTLAWYFVAILSRRPGFFAFLVNSDLLTS